MAILFMDGCDHYGADADIGDKWNVAGLSDYKATSGRFGGGCIELASFTVNEGVELTFAASSTIILNWAVNFSTGDIFGNSELIRFRSGGSSAFGLRTNTSGQILALRGTSTVLETSTESFSKGEWNYVEMKVFINGTTGTFQVKVDGVLWIDFTGDTLEASLTTVEALEMAATTAGGDTLIDDIILMDGTGSKNNDFIGDTKIETIYPSGDDTSDFTPTGAGSTNADRVDDGDAGPDDDTTYVESSTATDVDLYTMGNLTTSTIDSIIAVQSVSYAKKDDGGTRTGRSLVKTGTTTDNGPSQALVTSYKYFYDTLEDDPDTATDWTESGVNGVLVGHEVLT